MSNMINFAIMLISNENREREREREIDSYCLYLLYLFI